jgi:hypothetical protein
MASFTTLLNRAHRRFIDKFLKRREFGACEACGDRTLLIKLVQQDGTDVCKWDLCEKCYNKMVEDEIQ